MDNPIVVAIAIIALFIWGSQLIPVVAYYLVWIWTGLSEQFSFMGEVYHSLRGRSL